MMDATNPTSSHVSLFELVFHQIQL